VDPEWFIGIRILLFRSFRIRIQIRILPFEKGQLNNWKILSVHNGTAARLFKRIWDFRRKYVQHVIIKDELNYFEEKFAKIAQIFLSKSSDLDLDPDSVQLIWIRIRPGPKVRDQTESGSTALLFTTLDSIFTTFFILLFCFLPWVGGDQLSVPDEKSLQTPDYAILTQPDCNKAHFKAFLRYIVK
jgi:hypothetical protein